jgi:transcriptional regulator of acetoin/glycerol metabolism
VAGGSPARAARLLGVSRASIYNKLKAYGLA